MAAFEEYFNNRKKDDVDLRNRINNLEEKQTQIEQDVEANAEAIEELAVIVSGGDE